MSDDMIKKGFFPYGDRSGDNVTITICSGRDEVDVLEIRQFDNIVVIDMGNWAQLRDGIDAAIYAWEILHRAAQ